MKSPHPRILFSFSIALFAFLPLLFVLFSGTNDNASARSVRASSAANLRELSAITFKCDSKWRPGSKCTAVLSRHTCKELWKKLERHQNSSNAAIAGAIGVACSSVGTPVLGAFCAALAAVAAGRFMDELKWAAEKNTCLRFFGRRLNWATVIPAPPLVKATNDGCVDK